MTEHFDADEAKRFAHSVYGELSGWFGLSWMDGDKFLSEAFPAVEDAIARAAELDPDASSIYLRTTTMRAKPKAGRGLAEDSAWLPGLWADLDFGTVGHKATNLPPYADAARSVIRAAALPPPTLLVNSGGGLYPWWLLNEPAELSGGESLAEWAALSAAWQRQLRAGAESLGYHYGDGVGDLARVLRLPGSVNRKTAEERRCRVVSTDGPRYSAAAFSGALEAARMVVEPRPGPTAKAKLSDEEREQLDFRDATDPGPFAVLHEQVGIAGVLLAADWTECGCGRPGTLECFTRPGGASTTPHSAHIREAEPHVLVVFSEEARLPAGAGQRLTAGRLFAHLHHGGDLSAAAHDLLDAMQGGGTPAARDLGLPVQAVEVVGDPAFEEAVARKVNEALIEIEVRRRVTEHQSVTSGVQRLGAVDLSRVLDPSYEEPRPDILRLDDSDVCLLEQGATHSINGETGTGKSWLALLGAQQELDAGRHIVYIDCEDEESRIVGRLLALGVDREVIRARFSYRRPFGAWTEADVTGLLRYLTEQRVTLVVLDGVTDALALHGLSSNSDTDVAVLFSTFGGRLAAAGPAVVFIDHVTNEAGDAGTAVRARGSGFKVGGLSGTALFVDGETPMGRGIAGYSHVSIGRKVRGGWLQGHTVDGPAANKRRVALLEVDATTQPVVGRLLTPVAKSGGGASREFHAAAADDRMVEGITEVLAGSKEPRSKNWIATAYRAAGHKGGQTAVLRVVDYMTEEGLLLWEAKGWRLPIRDTGS